MPIELECKVRVGSLAEIRGRLQETGAEYVGQVLETNRLFDRRDGSLGRAGCGLRVRSVVVMDGNGPTPTLTYKGPRQDSAFKRRQEIEVPIGDSGAATEILHALGYTERVIFEKRRETWRLGPCQIELDELPELGTFVEIEGPDEAEIRTALAALGLSQAQSINKGYASMIAGLGADQGGASPLTLRFE
jgi:adenylate cyclase class 2